MEEEQLNLFERIEINTIFHFAGLKSVPESFLYPQNITKLMFKEQIIY